MVDRVTAAMMHFYHVPYDRIGGLPMPWVWRMMQQVPYLIGDAAPDGAAPAETQEEGQNVLADILTKAGAVGVRGPKA